MKPSCGELFGKGEVVMGPERRWLLSVWAVDSSPDSDPTGRVLTQYYPLDAAPVLEGEWKAHSPWGGGEV